jgi:hypothetical protein
LSRFRWLRERLGRVPEQAGTLMPVPAAPTPSASDVDLDSGNPDGTDARWHRVIAGSPGIARTVPHPSSGNPNETWAGWDRNRLNHRRRCAVRGDGELTRTARVIDREHTTEKPAVNPR